MPQRLHASVNVNGSVERNKGKRKYTFEYQKFLIPTIFSLTRKFSLPSLAIST